MKLLAIGDPHYTIKNQRDTIAFEKGIVSIIQEHQPEIVVVLGDILDTHEKYHADPFTRSINFLRMVRFEANSYHGKVIVLIGNHDRPNNSDFLSGKHPFVGFDRDSDNFILADCVQVVDTDECTLVCVPYVPPGRFQEALDTVQDSLESKEKVLILAHQEFAGAKMGVVKSMAGDEWGTDRPPVISGHIHDHHRLQTNILYVGTPFQKTYAENINRTVSLFDLTNFDPSNVLNTEKRLRVPGIVKKHTIRITTSDLSSFELNTDSDDLVKIYLSGTTQELASAKKHPKYLELSKNSNVKIHPVATAVTRTQTEIDEIEFEPLAKSFANRLAEQVSDDPSLTQILKDLGIV